MVRLKKYFHNKNSTKHIFIIIFYCENENRKYLNQILLILTQTYILFNALFKTKFSCFKYFILILMKQFVILHFNFVLSIFNVIYISLIKCHNNIFIKIIWRIIIKLHPSPICSNYAFFISMLWINFLINFKFFLPVFLNELS